MLATFSLRLACGLCGALLVLPAAMVNPRFYRVQFLTVLGFLVLPAVVAPPGLGLAWWLALGAGLVLAFLGSLFCSLEGVSQGKAPAVLAAAAALLTLGCVTGLASPAATWAWPLMENVTSAAVLGAATTAMLMGHAYLVMPTMSMTPLLRLLAALAVALLVRMAVAGIDLGSWTAGRARGTLEPDAIVWLTLRWGVGFFGPMVLTWMAWQAARIRSTQSATGILYVAVISCFIGEITNQVLQATRAVSSLESTVLCREHPIHLPDL
jgi:hypothetical protein